MLPHDTWVILRLRVNLSFGKFPKLMFEILISFSVTNLVWLFQDAWGRCPRKILGATGFLHVEIVTEFTRHILPFLASKAGPRLLTRGAHSWYMCRSIGHQVTRNRNVSLVKLRFLYLRNTSERSLLLFSYAAGMFIKQRLYRGNLVIAAFA